MLFRQPISVRSIIHVMLIVGAAAFALPFLWMLSTSWMVEKEVFDESGINLFPSLPRPRPVSPYVDAAQWDGFVPPRDLSGDTWAEWEPILRDRILAKLASLDLDVPPGIDVEAARREAAEGLWSEIAKRVPATAYLEPDLDAVLARIDADVTPDFAQSRLDAAHRCFAVSHVQFVRRSDLRQFRLTQDFSLNDLANLWRIESGPVTLVPRHHQTDRFIEAHYDFSKQDSFSLIADLLVPTAQVAAQAGIPAGERWRDGEMERQRDSGTAGQRDGGTAGRRVERSDSEVRIPPSTHPAIPPSSSPPLPRSPSPPLSHIGDASRQTGTADLPGAIKALSVAFRHDETWHGMSVQVEMGGKLYDAVRPTYLGLDRWAEFIVQPPSPEDDDPVRVKHYTVMKPIASGPRYDHGADRLRVRVTITRSSPTRAFFGKATLNYQLASRYVPFWRYAATSAVLVILNVGLTLASSSLVAYAFARLQWPGRDLLFIVLLGTMMIPAQVTMIPGFVIIKTLGWYNTLTPLWAFSAFGNAFSIFLLRQFLKGIPRDLEEAARIDGCGFLRVYWHVMLPLVKPTLAAIAVFTFIASWNDFMGPLIYVNDPRLYPLALGLFSLQAGEPPSPMPVLMAGSVLMTLPIVAIFFFAQKYFIQGVTLTGIKG